MKIIFPEQPPTSTIQLNFFKVMRRCYLQFSHTIMKTPQNLFSSLYFNTLLKNSFIPSEILFVQYVNAFRSLDEISMT